MNYTSQKLYYYHWILIQKVFNGIIILHIIYILLTKITVKVIIKLF
jgi:hypothetical protein